MTDLDFTNLGLRIKAMRKKRGFTQAKLAETVECSTPYISYIEQGRKSMSLEMFVLVANAINASADELLHDSLENTIAVSNHEFEFLLSDCSSYEMRLLLDIVRAAKKSMRDNQRLIVNRYR